MRLAHEAPPCRVRKMRTSVVFKHKAGAAPGSATCYVVCHWRLHITHCFLSLLIVNNALLMKYWRNRLSD